MCARDGRFVDRFSMGQKIVLRLLLVAFCLVGLIAVFRHDALWGWIYLGVLTLGQAVLVVPNLCARCPYPYEYNDCLFVPAGLLRTLVPRRTSPMGPAGKGALLAGAGALVVIPQYALFQEPLLLILFWALLLPFLGFFPLYLCRHCRHTGCPANRTGGGEPFTG